MTLCRMAISGLGLLCLTGCPTNFSRPPSSLSSRTIHTLIAPLRVQGSIARSPDGNTIAFSNGQNIYTLDLTDPNARPVQLTNQTSAFTPSFLDNGDIIFGSTSAGSLDTITFQRVSASAFQGSPAPTTVQTLTATDLRFAENTPLTAPTQFAFNPAGTSGIGTINNQPFIIDFGPSPISVTPLNDVFGEPIINPVISSDGSTFAATTAEGQVISGPIVNGVVLPSDIQPVGPGSFPSFSPNGNLNFFTTNGFSFANGTGGFNSVGLGSPAFTPTFPSFAPDSNSFITTTANGSAFVDTSIPSAEPGIPGFDGSPP